MEFFKDIFRFVFVLSYWRQEIKGKKRGGGWREGMQKKSLWQDSNHAAMHSWCASVSPQTTGAAGCWEIRLRSPERAKTVQGVNMLPGSCILGRTIRTFRWICYSFLYFCYKLWVVKGLSPHWKHSQPVLIWSLSTDPITRNCIVCVRIAA